MNPLILPYPAGADTLSGGYLTTGGVVGFGFSSGLGVEVLPGIVEAAKDALKALLAAHLSDLNARLQQDDLWGDMTSVDSTMLFLGDPKTVPPFALAPLWICVFGGEEMVRGSQTNLDITGGAGYRTDLELTLRIYLHPEAFPSSSVKTQAENRERALDRVCDWLRRGVCNTHENKTLLLGSNEYGTGADELNETHITRIVRDDYYKSFGDMTLVRGAEATWTGYIE